MSGVFSWPDCVQRGHIPVFVAIDVLLQFCVVCMTERMFSVTFSACRIIVSTWLAMHECVELTINEFRRFVHGYVNCVP